MNKVVATAIKGITHLRPNIADSYQQQRLLEDASARLVVADPRCRIDYMSVEATDGHSIPVRVYTPLDIDFSLKSGLHVSEDYRGTILFFHGGGWANGDAAFYNDSCMRTALKLERRVVSVDYRRSPEHRFPTPAEDCYEVARQLFAKELLPDVVPEHITLFGDSAGGNLTSVVSLMARDRGEFMPTSQMLLYPLTYSDHSMTTIFDSVRDNGQDYLLTRQDIVDYVGLYLAKPEDYDNPYFAPLLATDLSRQPRTLVISAEFCPLRDEGETYAARLAADGNDVQCFRMLNGVHGYFLYPTILDLVRSTYDVMRHFLDGSELDRRGEPSWMELLAGS